MRAFLVGAVLGLGLWLLVRGLFPTPVDLAQRLARYAEERDEAPSSQTVISSAWGRLAIWLLRSLRGELITDVEADVDVVGGTLQGHATDKLNAGAGGGVLFPVIALLFGFATSAPVLLILSVFGAIIFYLAPDIELRGKAATRRAEFDEALTGFVSLVAVSISGGGGVNSAMSDATDIGRSWCFILIGRSLEESALVGESPWAGLNRMGRRLNLVSLIEFAGALSLAGTSGARVAETLQVRAESSRKRELAEVRAEAEKNSESMGVPIAAMLLGWFGFMGYPAVINLLGS